jgi:hypothetical protein
MTINIDDLESLLDKATKGPWSLDGGTMVNCGPWPEKGTTWIRCGAIVPCENDTANAALIAAAVNTLPELIAEVRMLRNALASLVKVPPSVSTATLRLLADQAIEHDCRDEGQALAAWLRDVADARAESELAA